MNVMIRKSVVAILAIMIALSLMGQECMALSALPTKTQTENAVPKSYSKGFTRVSGPSWTFVKKPKYKWWNKSSTKRLYYKSNKSTKGAQAKFQRWLKLAVDNPQSMTVTPDGNTLFIMTAAKHSAKEECNWKGYIIRIDLKGIRKDPEARKILASGECLDVYVCGKKGKPRKAEKPYVYYRWLNKKGQELDDVFWDAREKALEEDQEKDQVDYDDPNKLYSDGFDREKWGKANGFRKTKIVDDDDFLYRKYIKFSKQMVVGHGQTLAYNPKTKKLWFFPNMTYKNGRAVMVDPRTLTQVRAINFRFKNTIKCPSTLTFDNSGNAYCYSLSGSRKNSNNVAKIYKGTISPNKVRFTLIKSGVAPGPGAKVQGLGYNPKLKRLYLLSDSSIVGVPTARLSTAKSILRSSDIRVTHFPGNREFEDIAFDNKGNGYFLTNKPDEIMVVNKGF